MTIKIKEKFNESVELKDNAMLRKRPELFHEWNFEKNDELGLDVYEATRGSSKIAWWICTKCGSPYDLTIALRFKLSSCCPFGAGSKVNHTNSLASLKPDIAQEWHPILNGDLTPNDVTLYNNTKVWWLGNCGHHWDTIIANRTNLESNCPYCTNQKILIGFNDMWTTNPELASLLANPADGYKYTQSSGMKVDWKCLECENIIKSKKIYSIGEQGLSCPKCSDGIYFPEKFTYNLLREENIQFDFEVSFEWSQGKRYDFYLPELDWIIETHGGQHYEQSKRGRSLKGEQENDKLKRRLAKENGISNYIVIDCRYSTVDWIKNSILNSDIMKIVKDADFEKIGRLTSNSLVREACDLWNSKNHSTIEIANLLCLDRNTVTRYLKRGTEIGWCDYNAKESKKNNGKHGGRLVVQLDIKLNLLGHWESMKEAELHTGVSVSNMSCATRGKTTKAGGFKWMYKEDYERMLEEDMSHDNYMSKYYPKQIA